MKTKFILLFAIIFFILLYFFYFLKPDFSSKVYNQKEWNNNPNIRLQMANNIIESKMLIGKDSIQILNELGKYHNEPIKNEWKYLLGYKGYLRAEFYFLTISFNNGKVNKVDIETVEEN